MKPLKPCPFCLSEGAKLIELAARFVMANGAGNRPPSGGPG